MGGFLGDVGKTLGAVVSAEKGDLRDLTNIMQGKPTIAEQQQTLFDQLYKTAANTTQGNDDIQLKTALAQKDYKGASKRVTELRNTDEMISAVDKDTKIPEDDKIFIKNYLRSGGNINNAATLIQQAKQAAAKAPEKALITKGRKLNIAAQEAAAQQKELEKGGLVGKIGSVIDEQIKRGLITNLDQLKASIKAELRGTEAERETLANEIAIFWTKNEPRFFGLLPDKAVFSGQPRVQPQPTTTSTTTTTVPEQTTPNRFYSPSQKRYYRQKPDGTYEAE